LIFFDPGSLKCSRHAIGVGKTCEFIHPIIIDELNVPGGQFDRWNSLPIGFPPFAIFHPNLIKTTRPCFLNNFPRRFSGIFLTIAIYKSGDKLTAKKLYGSWVMQDMGVDPKTKSGRFAPAGVTVTLKPNPKKPRDMLYSAKIAGETIEGIAMVPRQRGNAMDVRRRYGKPGDSVPYHFMRYRLLPSGSKLELADTHLDSDFPVSGNAEDEIVLGIGKN